MMENGSLLIAAIDDSPISLGMYRLIVDSLYKKGHNVEFRELSGPAEAMQLARQRPPFVTIVDYHMPGCNGDRIISILKKYCSRSQYVMVSQNQDQAPEAARQLEVPFLSKSEASKKLPDLLEALIRKHLRNVGKSIS